MGKLRWPWVNPKDPESHEPSTLPEAQEALKRSRIERLLVARMRPRVDKAAEELAHQRELNHMAERFREALRGGTT